MFTWNYQYISKARLESTLQQMLLQPEDGDILVRIHTSIHLGEEAVELARFVKTIVPTAKILGTSTSAVINWGKFAMNQCVISVTQMNGGGTVKTAILKTPFREGIGTVSAEELGNLAFDEVLTEDAKFSLVFLAGSYHKMQEFFDIVNERRPGLSVTGGIVNVSEIGLQKDRAPYVFDENGYVEEGIILASFCGPQVDCCVSYATGAQAIGDEYEITDAVGNYILALEHVDAAKEYRTGVGQALKRRPELAELFPLVYSDRPDLPVPIVYQEGKSLTELFPPGSKMLAARPDLNTDAKVPRIMTNHTVTVGRKLRRAFIYDRKIITDNQAMFRHIENFEKPETLFGYSGASRSHIYSNCAKWELSAYENSNMCGCVTAGEFICANGRNTISSCSFLVSAVGEAPATQECNPYAFSHTASLTVDNQALLNHLMEVENYVERRRETATAGSLRAFVRDCEMKLLYSEHDDIPNEAALNMDMKLKGYDRICLINVPDTSSMRLVFPEETIQLTYRTYVTKCAGFAKKRNYRMYTLDGWQIAIAAPSYACSLPSLVRDMEILQKELFHSPEGLIAIVPIFCIINGCNVENLQTIYGSARIEMLAKNVQFYVCDAGSYQSDEESIRERYRMVNLINYAIANDGIVPYYQGIHDNATGTIHHYESLMRLVDENGAVYAPYRFLDVARSYGLLYDSVSRILIHKVFERFRDVEGVSVSINLGIRDIKNREIMDDIYDALATAKYPGNFVFEILENEDVDSYDALESFVDRVHQLGGLISIDDFGSGYSNLQHVVGIHADFLKIDGSIIRKCCESRDAEHLITLIMGWRRLSQQNLRVIAEFVESAEIQEMVLRYGIDFSQGYLFSKPSPDIPV